jgi:trans-2,3-dihydro-3-hydroxyanthranilate isomerase
MKADFLTCDVFTERPFAGNPLLVVPDARGLTPGQMQAIAREINYSESTFVLPPDDPRHAYRQRTFVPFKEIPYAGHPTIGTAVVMAALGRAGARGEERITVEVGFGPLELELIRREGAVTRVRMSQGTPAWEAPIADLSLRARLTGALGLPENALHGGLPPQVVSTGNRTLVIPLGDVAAVSAAVADVRTLNALEKELDVLIAYFFAFDGERVRARAFCPGAGVPEDPATGSAAGPLGIYLALHGALPGGSPLFFIDQGIEMGRPSEIEVTVERAADGTPSGVKVAGSAILMMRGSIKVSG